MKIKEIKNKMEGVGLSIKDTEILTGISEEKIKLAMQNNYIFSSDEASRFLKYYYMLTRLMRSRKRRKEIKKDDMEIKTDVEVKGVMFEGRQERIEKVCIGDEVDLVPEPDNPYDKNAIKLTVRDMDVGYIPKEVNQNIQPYLEKGLKGRIRCLGNYQGTYWMRVDVLIRAKETSPNQ